MAAPSVENVVAAADDVDDVSYSSEELGSLLNNLSDADKYSLCNGDYYISSNSDITIQVFGVLYCIAESFSSNKNKALEQMLPCLNDNLPQINARNLVRKYKSLSEKAEKLPESERCELLKKEIVLPVTTQWKELQEYFYLDKLFDGIIEEKNPAKVFTVELFIQLGRLRGKCSSLNWNKICNWLARKYQCERSPTPNAVSTEFCNLQRKLYRLRSCSDEKRNLLVQDFLPPLPKINPQPPIFPANDVTQDKTLYDMVNELEEARDLEIYHCYQEVANLNVQFLKATKDLESVMYDSEATKRENVRKVNLLRHELQRMTTKYESLKIKLQEKSVQLSKYLPRNAAKRENRRSDQIIALESDKRTLKLENNELQERISDLEERLTASNALYDKERKRVFYYKSRNLNQETDQKEKIGNLKEYIKYLENENAKLTEEIEQFLNQDEIKTFCNGKYNDEVRILYYELLSMNVSVHNCEKVVRSVLGRLASLKIDRLPKKSVASVMMVEGRMLALMQAGQAMAESKNNVLHLDGTKLNFEEIGSFQVVTESGAYTFGIEDMISGEGKTYLDTFRDILTEAAALLAPPEQCENKANDILISIKNVMTDRCTVNGTFVAQLKEWRDNVIPKVVENYNDLPEEEKEKLSRINHLFCGIHVLHNLGTYTEESVKEFEKIAALVNQHSGFQTSNSRTYDMLYEISKLCSYTHGDQRNGKAKEWKAFLEKKGISNKIVSFLHHRFNIYFVLGGAVYFHRNHLKELLISLEGENFLQTSILADIETKMFLASFRALGIINKLVTGPVYRKIEEEGHIFELNEMWLELKVLFERCSKNASPLMDGEVLLSSVQISKDSIYEELFKETNDLELDTLTQECLEIICCSCAVVIVRQLGDQLPGGKFYQPTSEVLQETSLCQRTNILSERDFAQMDRKVKQKQNISTIAASGTIMFLNNRTLDWLLSKSEEDLCKAITIARKAAPLRIKYYRRKKKQILEKRMDSLEKKKVQKEVKEQEKFDERATLLAELEKYGGIWNSLAKLEEESSTIKEADMLKAFQLQIKARRVVLNQSVPDPKILQQGTTLDGKYAQHKVPQLKENLSKAISFSEMSTEDRAAQLARKFITRPEEDRQKMFEEAKVFLQKKAEKCAMQNVTKRLGKSEVSRTKKKRPKLFGKRIKHKWDDGWYLGTVVKVYGDDEYAVDCEFGVKYDDFPEEYEVDLMEDWENDWVVVCKGGQEIKGKGKEVVDKPDDSDGKIMMKSNQVGDEDVTGKREESETIEERRPKRKKRKLNKN